MIIFNDGIWNKTGTSISLTIHPPWWRTMRDYGICLQVLQVWLESICELLSKKREAMTEEQEVKKKKQMKKKFRKQQVRIEQGRVKAPTDRQQDDDAKSIAKSEELHQKRISTHRGKWKPLTSGDELANLLDTNAGWSCCGQIVYDAVCPY